MPEKGAGAAFSSTSVQMTSGFGAATGRSQLTFFSFNSRFSFGTGVNTTTKFPW